MKIPAHVLVGPTGSGKSRIAQWIALQGSPPRVILAADSMTIYRGMDVGTAKPTAAERALVPTFGMDIAKPDQAFSVGDYLVYVRNHAAEIAAAVEKSGMPLLVVGGTGLYLKCLTEGLASAPPVSAEIRREAKRILDEQGLAALQEAARALHPAEYVKLRDPENPRRVLRAYELLSGGEPLPDSWAGGARPVFVGLSLPREVLKQRIVARAQEMYADNALVAEVAGLRGDYWHFSDTAERAIGYAEAADLLDEKITEDGALRVTTRRTTQYAKRQMTWFRHQANVEWVALTGNESTEEAAAKVMAAFAALPPVELQLS